MHPPRPTGQCRDSARARLRAGALLGLLLGACSVSGTPVTRPADGTAAEHPQADGILDALGLGREQAGPPGSLEGTELAPIASLGTSAVNALAALGRRERDQEALSIGSVRVLIDDERRLAVRVAFRGAAAGRAWGRIKDRAGAVREEIVSEPRLFRGAQVRLDFALDPAGPPDLAFESGSLELFVAASDGAAPPPERSTDAARSFKLHKRWSTHVPPERLIVEVTPQPLPATAALLAKPESAPAPRPERAPDRKFPLSIPWGQSKQPGVRERGEAPAVQTRDVTVLDPRVVNDRLRAALESGRLTGNAAQPDRSRLKGAQDLVAITRDFRWGQDPKDADRSARGPGSSRIDLLAGLHAPSSDSGPEIDVADVMRIEREVYEDANPRSGIYYYLPSRYHLDWRPRDGYGLAMLYQAAEATGAAGGVVIALRMDAGVDLRELELARSLLRAWARRSGRASNIELRRMPLDGPPRVALSDQLQAQYEIPAERIAVDAVSDTLGEIQVSFLSDVVTKENLQLALVEDVGIRGMVFYDLEGEGDLFGIPLTAQLAHPGTFGQLRWDSGSLWRNELPYPVRLEYLHGIKLVGDQPVLYTWALGEAEVPPGARVRWDAGRVPSSFQREALRMWLAYSVDADCRSCDEAVIASITGGVTAVAASVVTIKSLTPLADLGAHEIVLQIRTPYAHPTERDSRLLPEVAIGADDSTFTTGPIHALAQPGEPIFEYRLDLVMPDGRTLRGSQWIASDGLTLRIGSHQVQQSVGVLPQAESGAPPPSEDAGDADP